VNKLPDFQRQLYDTTRELIRTHIESDRKTHEEELQELCAIIGIDPEGFFEDVKSETKIGPN